MLNGAEQRATELPRTRTRTRARRWLLVYGGQAAALLVLYLIWYAGMVGAHVNESRFSVPAQQAEVNYGHHSAITTVTTYCIAAIVVIAVGVAAGCARRWYLLAAQVGSLVVVTLLMVPYLTWALFLLNPNVTSPSPAPGYGACFSPGDCPGDGGQSPSG